MKSETRAKLAQSTTVTTPSTVSIDPSFWISQTSGPGSAEPLASTRMRCGRISHSAVSASDSSPTLVQHRQPLVTSRTEMRSSAATAESTAASPYSFLSHAHV